jgi:hypothetical protein
MEEERGKSRELRKERICKRKEHKKGGNVGR